MTGEQKQKYDNLIAKFNLTASERLQLHEMVIKIEDDAFWLGMESYRERQELAEQEEAEELAEDMRAAAL